MKDWIERLKKEQANRWDGCRRACPQDKASQEKSGAVGRPLKGEYW